MYIAQGVQCHLVTLDASFQWLFVVDTVTLGQVFLQVFHFSSGNQLHRPAKASTSSQPILRLVRLKSKETGKGKVVSVLN
jgi:hypothetical protein